jgi:rubredoxin
MNPLELKMVKWVCTSCGYVYDPSAGDPGHGVKPDTAFELLPDGWQCPICYAAKEAFDPL